MRTKRQLLPWLIIIFGITAVFATYIFLPPLATLQLYKKYYRPWQHKRAKIILLHYGGMGEREFAARLKIACQNMHIDLLVFDTHPEKAQKKNLPSSEQIRKIVSIYKPNFVLVLEDLITDFFPGAPNYRALTRGGSNRYVTLSAQGRHELTFPYFKRAQGLLTAFEDTTLVTNAFIEDGNRPFIVPWHMTVYDTHYQSTQPNKLFYTGSHLWDTTRSSNKYLEVFSKLDKTRYFTVCGVAANWQHTPNSYVGQLPLDGKSVLAAINKAGVSLLLHDQEHLIGGAPSSRIFEAAAANAVIISDRHPFIEKYFGNNVLYIDVTKDAQNMFAQIDKHMQWIFANPQVAQAMAQNCNDIYKKQFLLEKQIDALLAMDQEYKLYQQFVKNIKPTTSIDWKELPKSLQQLRADNLPLLWSLIQVKNSKITFYFNKLKPPHNTKHWVNKLYTMAQQLERMHKSGKTIPDGTYLLSLEDGIHATPAYPVLAFASDRTLVAQQQVVLLPDNEALNGYADLFKSIDMAKQSTAWSEKRKQIFWRGQTTGLDFQVDKSKMFPRLAFLHKALGAKHIDAGFTHVTADMDPTMLQAIQQRFPLRDFVSPAASLKYRYLLDIDGHSCSYSRMAWILYSNSLLLKHESDKIQWYYDRLRAYEHFLPIAANFDNLDTQYKWAEEHPLEVQSMIRNAQILAQDVFNTDAITQATQQAFIKYNLLVN